MKIVTWNVNSLKARHQLVAEYLDEESPDVLAIQELKLEESQVPRELFESRGYHLAIHAQKQWNGVLIASREPISEVICGFPGEGEQARLVSGVVSGIRLVNVYCPQGQAADSEKFPYKLRFFEALAEWLDETATPQTPLVLLGDINVAPAQRDVHDPVAMWGVPTFHPRELEAWGRLTWWGLHDAVVDHVEPGSYSFWDYREGAFKRDTGFRIDHLLCTAPVGERVEAAWIDRDWRKKRGEQTPSDHAPVGIRLR